MISCEKSLSPAIQLYAHSQRCEDANSIGPYTSTCLPARLYVGPISIKRLNAKSRLTRAAQVVADNWHAMMAADQQSQNKRCPERMEMVYTFSAL